MLAGLLTEGQPDFRNVATNELSGITKGDKTMGGVDG